MSRKCWRLDEFLNRMADRLSDIMAASMDKDYDEDDDDMVELTTSEDEDADVDLPADDLDIDIEDEGHDKERELEDEEHRREMEDKYDEEHMRDEKEKFDACKKDSRQVLKKAFDAKVNKKLKLLEKARLFDKNVVASMTDRQILMKALKGICDAKTLKMKPLSYLEGQLDILASKRQKAGTTIQALGDHKTYDQSVDKDFGETGLIDLLKIKKSLTNQGGK